jgi:hypothetical protein
MQEYRINNQAFCERNYIPKMLGWYLLTPTTCLSDMEWMLARAAGFDAGFALATSPTSLRRNPETARLLDALREWENARRSGAFPAGLREQLRNPKREFHLEPIAAGAWDIFPFHDSPEFTHAQVERQPGEPTSAQWAWANPDQAQALQFKLRGVGGGGSITNAAFEVGRSAALQLPVEVRAGQTLLVEGDAIARVYDAQGRQISATPLKMRPPTVEGGTNSVQFDCEFQGEVPPKAIVTFKTKGAPERVSAPAARP